MKTRWLFIIILCFTFLPILETSKITRKIDYGYSLNFTNFTPKKILLKEKNDNVAPMNFKGISKLRIVNGLAASRGQFCYQAYLQFTDDSSCWSCGGSLVTSSKVLTAAHCVSGALSATVVLGALDLDKYEAGRVVMTVRQSGMRVHEQYDEVNAYNDLALVTLTREVKLTKYICTLKLPSCASNNETLTENNKYTVSGWGKTTDRTLTYHLMYVNVTAESQSSCATYFKTYADYRIIPSQMCTSGAQGKSTCNGDSGGPLVMTDSSGAEVQQGIVSLGMSSCELSAPSVYTNLNYFMAWLCPLLN